MKKKFSAGGQEDVDVDVRITWSKLPKCLQWFLTWFSGKPLEGQTPLIKRSNLSHLFTAYGWLLAGIVLSFYGQLSGFYVLVPVGWLFTVSGARKLIPTINHYCAHGDLLPSQLREKYKWLHPYIADFNSALLWLQDYATYRAEHLMHHKLNVVASIVDPDMAFMWQLGFKAGMSKRRLWMVLLWNLIIPFSKLHRLFIKSRVKTTFLNSSKFRAMVQLVTLAVLIYMSYATSLFTVIVAVVVPMTYFYHMASLLQFASEHLWLNTVDETGRLPKTGHNKVLIPRSKRITNARFCGEPLSILETDSALVTLGKTFIWVIKMVFFHLPARIFVLSGDLIVHDWHHRCKFGSDWANAFYARAEMAKKLEDTEFPLTEVWGLGNALNLVFENLSKMPEIDPALVEEDADAVLGM